MAAVAMTATVGTRSGVEHVYVDHVAGNDTTGTGTALAPYATITHAISTSRTSAYSAGQTLYVNVTPSTSAVADVVAITAAVWTGGRCVIRSATTAAVKATGTYAITYGAAQCDLVLQHIDFACQQIQTPLGSNPTANLHVSCIDCTFTQIVNPALTLAWQWGSEAGGALELYGSTVTGWGRVLLASGAYFERLIITDSTITSNAQDLAATYLALSCSDECRITYSTITTSGSSAGVGTWDITPTGSCSDIVIDHCTIALYSSGTAGIIQIEPKAAGGTPTVNVTITNNTITEPSAAGTAAPLRIGREINGALTRAENDALVTQFLSVLVDSNTITATGVDAWLLPIYPGADGAVISNNVLQRGSIGGGGTNVHVVYLYASGVTFTANELIGEVLAFGPNQIITDNVIVSESLCILLAGTGGGSTALGGGNNYTITGNILVAYDGSIFSDYAYNGAFYGAGNPLVCMCDSNVYVKCSGADYTAIMCSPAQNCAALANLVNVWATSTADGSGATVWGDASNSDNDAASSEATAGEIATIEAYLAGAGTDLSTISAMFP